jgi:hypothetical protein
MPCTSTVLLSLYFTTAANQVSLRIRRRRDLKSINPINKTQTEDKTLHYFSVISANRQQFCKGSGETLLNFMAGTFQKCGSRCSSTPKCKFVSYWMDSGWCNLQVRQSSLAIIEPRFLSYRPPANQLDQMAIIWYQYSKNFRAATMIIGQTSAVAILHRFSYRSPNTVALIRLLLPLYQIHQTGLAKQAWNHIWAPWQNAKTNAR